MAPESRAQKKERYFNKVCSFLDDYDRAFIVHADNVSSNQFMLIRAGLRDNSVILMGKNTMMKRCIRIYLEAGGANQHWSCLLDLLVGNVGVIFTKTELTNVRDKMNTFKVGAPARSGVVAPVPVIIPAGPTGMDPSQTSFFQTLNIPTKINKGSIEILADHVVFREGDKVTASAAILLAKLKILPFTYGLEIVNCIEHGSIFPKEVLDLSDDDIRASFGAGLRQVAALCLGANYPTIAAMPHIMINAYKNVLAIAVETEYSFPQGDKIKEMLANPGAFASAAPAAGAAKGGAAAAKAPEPEPEEEEEEDMGFDLFD